MVQVRPFRGVRPRPDLAARVASPPYDVLSLAEARSMAAGNPASFLRINRAELELDANVDPHDPIVYERARANLGRFLEEGTLIRDPRPSFYLYRLTMSGRRQTGLVALSSVADYRAGRIKRHEKTRPAKVMDRSDHIMTLSAQVGPVFSTYRQRPEIAELFRRVTEGAPGTDFTADDGVRHELWVIDDEPVVQDIARVFEGMECCYIADGHHRSEAASEVARRLEAKPPGPGESDAHLFFLNVLFPDSELHILPYNRVVRDLGGLTLDDLLRGCESRFRVSEHSGPVRPERPHHFGVYADRGWYSLEARDGSFDPDSPTGSVDASVLSDNVLAPLLGITDPRTDPRIGFVGGIRGVEELERLVNGGEYAVAFSLPATTIDQLLRVADAGEVMPPKSTWFEPKLRSGMVVNLLTG